MTGQTATYALAPIRNVLYATGMIRQLAQMTPAGAKGTKERASFVDTCVHVFGVTSGQVEDALDG